MAVWVVRAGRRGEQEEEALKGDFVTIHWIKLRNLTPIQDREALRTLYEKTYPDESPKQVAGRVGQVLAFRKKIEPGHLVVLPRLLKSKRAEVAIGKVKGPYCYRNDTGADILHTLPVQWLSKDVPRTRFKKDLRGSFNCHKAVYEIGRDKVEQRIQAVLSNWNEKWADRKVRAAIEKLFCPEPHNLLLEFVQGEVAGLDAAEIKASLSRICKKIKIT